MQDSVFGIQEPIESDMMDEWKTTNSIALEIKTWWEKVETNYYSKNDAGPMLTRAEAESKLLLYGFNTPFVK